MNIVGQAWNVIFNNIAGWSQYKGISSIQKNINKGVIQRNPCSPILFNAYVNDLPSQIEFGNLFQYCDDTTLLGKINSTENVTLLQNDLNNIMNWCIISDLSMNASKSYH